MAHRGYWYLSRTLCETLEEMRACVKTANYSVLPALIEEAQMMGTRMEQALGDKRDIPKMIQERENLRLELKALGAQLPNKDE